ncbi:hypothetical protein [Bradyrhizobium sp. SZCCHNRI2049]|uniref:hypothetical protein n=1 Tax=Bradyrhizobium sp. SZCCHNRI2049 TaxID=3057287 RepID=UPI002915EF4B|nr:hypothetical protein [Bradyrhizobium sp. SZCCHNRI2049]
MTPLMRPPTLDDVEFIANHMRKADVEECAASGFTPLGALLQSIDLSIVCKCAIAPDTGQPGFVMGVCPSTLGPSWGAIWLLGTDDIKRHRVLFLRHSREVLASLYEETGKEVFYNYTFIENSVHHEWLRWLGFKFLRKVSLPPHGQQFIEFVKLKG